MAKASAKTVIGRERTRGEKTEIPRIPELSPAKVCAQTQDEGHWFMSHGKLQGLFIDACDAIGAKPNVDYDEVVIPFLINRLAAGVGQRAVKGDVPEGMRYSVTRDGQRGPHRGILVTMVPVNAED